MNKHPNNDSDSNPSAEPWLATLKTGMQLPAAEVRTRSAARNAALREFRNAGDTASAPHASHWRRLAIGLGALSALLCAVVILQMLQTRGGNDSAGSDQHLSRIMTEMESLFAAQFTAAVIDGDSVDIQLAPTAGGQAPPSDQRIRLTLRRDQRTITVLGYSGRPFTLKLDGRMIEVTPLLGGDGGVFLVTADSVIESFDTNPEQLAGYRIASIRRIMEPSPQQES